MRPAPFPTDGADESAAVGVGERVAVVECDDKLGKLCRTQVLEAGTGAVVGETKTKVLFSTAFLKVTTSGTDVLLVASGVTQLVATDGTPRQVWSFG